MPGSAGGWCRVLVSTNRRNGIGLLVPSGGGLFAPTPDFGRCRNTNGPTTRMRPFVLRLADGK